MSCDLQINQTECRIKRVLCEMKANDLESVVIKLIECESGFNPNAIGDEGTSFGIFQFKKSTWEKFCSGNIWSVEDQTKCTIDILRDGGYDHWYNCFKQIVN